MAAIFTLKRDYLDKLNDIYRAAAAEVADCADELHRLRNASWVGFGLVRPDASGVNCVKNSN